MRPERRNLQCLFKVTGLLFRINRFVVLDELVFFRTGFLRFNDHFVCSSTISPRSVRAIVTNSRFCKARNPSSSRNNASRDLENVSASVTLSCADPRFLSVVSDTDADVVVEFGDGQADLFHCVAVTQGDGVFEGLVAVFALTQGVVIDGDAEGCADLVLAAV